MHVLLCPDDCFVPTIHELDGLHQQRQAQGAIWNMALQRYFSRVHLLQSQETWTLKFKENKHCSSAMQKIYVTNLPIRYLPCTTESKSPALLARTALIPAWDRNFTLEVYTKITKKKAVHILSELLTCSSMRPISGLITTAMADELDARGARNMHKLFPPSVAMHTYYVSLPWRVGRRASSCSGLKRSNQSGSAGHCIGWSKQHTVPIELAKTSRNRTGCTAQECRWGLCVHWHWARWHTFEY